MRLPASEATAADESPRQTKPHDCTSDTITLDEVERIGAKRRADQSRDRYPRISGPIVDMAKPSQLTLTGRTLSSSQFAATARRRVRQVPEFNHYTVKPARVNS
jgi:hypothetical protein